MRLGAVFHQPQAVAIADRLHGINIEGLAIQVHTDDTHCGGIYCSRGSRRIDVPSAIEAVYKYRRGADC